MKSGVFLTF